MLRIQAPKVGNKVVVLGQSIEALMVSVADRPMEQEVLRTRVQLVANKVVVLEQNIEAWLVQDCRQELLGLLGRMVQVELLL